MNFRKISPLLVLLFIMFSGFALHSEVNGVRFCDTDAEFFKAPGEGADSKTVIILPGGGYQGHAMDHEGYDWIPFFHRQGVNVVVLKYNLPYGNPDLPLTDVETTLLSLKEKAGQLDINPDKIGIMGFSAGGHLASTYATHTSGESQPAFQILFYPVISFDPAYVHEGSRDNLLGDVQNDQILEFYSNEKQVKKDTPPAILFHSDDDGFVPRENSVLYYLSLNKAGVPAALHIYPVGGHGWGFRESFPYHDVMLEELAVWLKNLELPQK